MPAQPAKIKKLPGKYDELVAQMPPHALQDDAQLKRAAGMIDRLMGLEKPTKDQRLYLETLVQLVQAYESDRSPIPTDDLTGLDSLKHLLTQHSLCGSDLARLLGVHASMGSKLLSGERSLTVEHIKTLSRRFCVSPALFI